MLNENFEHFLSREELDRFLCVFFGGNSLAMYPDIENPTDAIRFCRQPTHTAPQFQQSSDGLTVWNCKGYRLTKSTHGVEEGTWYFEVRVLEEGGQPSKTNKANLRIGWAQISADLQGPCGMDPFSYGYRMDPGTVFNQSRGTGYGSGYGEQDDFRSSSGYREYRLQSSHCPRNA